MRLPLMCGVGAALALSACVQSGDVLRSDAVPEVLPARAALVTQVSASNEHTCALREAMIYCWGNNSNGELGVVSEQDRLTPTALEQTGWQSVDTGYIHTCALSLEGQVYCWGDGARGQLGQGDRAPSRLPVRVQLESAARAISSSFNHSCALLENSELWCWGANESGQLGQDDSSPEADEQAADALLPVLVPSPAGAAPWKLVSTGEGHTCALQTDESLWCWGRNSQGQLGVPSKTGELRVPVLVGNDHVWARLDVGGDFTCALDADGSFWCWGHNKGTNSGSGNPFGSESIDLLVPTRVGAGPWADISTGWFHTCGIDAAAELWCWGRATDGQLAALDGTLRLEPLRAASDVARVSTGYFSTCFIALDGSLQCAGKNNRLQLGEAGREEWIFLPVTLPPRAADAGP